MPSMRLLVLLVLFVFATSVAAIADEEAREDPADEVASAHLDRAWRAFEGGAYSAAILEFQGAAAVMTPSQLDYYVARCLDGLGHEVAALDRYRQSSRAIGDDSYARAARDRMSEMMLRAATRLHPPRSLGPPILGGVTALLVGTVGATLVGSTVEPLHDLKTTGACTSPCGAERALHARADVGYALLGATAAVALVDVVLWSRWARARRPASLEMWQSGAGLRF
jgi:hypothetical protein